VILSFLERAARRGMNATGIESLHVDGAAGRMHLYRASSGGRLPPMALIHGLGSSATSYWRLLARLRPHTRRLVAPDLPGHGFSQVPEPFTPEAIGIGLAELLDRELDEPAIVCGNSLGGGIALRYALLRPQKVRALILCSPAGAEMTEEDFQAVLRSFRHENRAEAHQFLRKLYYRPPWYLSLVARDIHRLFSRGSFRDLLGAMTPELAFRPDELAGLTTPVLLLWGRSDQILPRAGLEFYRRTLPTATIEEPEGFGHCPHLDDPDALAERMVAFAAQLT
jgi:pimeloyl-ACP methyl ester carboxylesterase